MPKIDHGNDHTLISSLIAGEEWAFKSIFNTYYNRLLRFATSYLRDEELAEDIVQDAFIVLWERRTTLAYDSQNLFAFLVQIVKLKTLNHIEKTRRRNSIEQGLYLTELRQLELDYHTLNSLNISHIMLSEIQSTVNLTLSNLPDLTREIFEWSRNHYLTNKEIAAKLGKSDKTIEYHLTKALKALRLALSDYLYLLFFLLYF